MGLSAQRPAIGLSAWLIVNCGSAVFFRFSAALVLVVLVSMAGVMLEKRTLELRRAVSRQYYHTDLLVEHHVRLRLETQQLTSVSQLTAGRPLSEYPAPQPGVRRSAAVQRNAAESDGGIGEAAPARLPLLRFQQPFSPEGID